MPKPVLSTTRSYSRQDPSIYPPRSPIAERNKLSPHPLFAEICPLKGACLNANTAPYFLNESKTTNTPGRISSSGGSDS